jgi:hypothetical protein
MRGAHREVKELHRGVELPLDRIMGAWLPWGGLSPAAAKRGKQGARWRSLSVRNSNEWWSGWIEGTRRLLIVAHMRAKWERQGGEAQRCQCWRGRVEVVHAHVL